VLRRLDDPESRDEFETTLAEVRHLVGCSEPRVFRVAIKPLLETAPESALDILRYAVASVRHGAIKDHRRLIEEGRFGEEHPNHLAWLRDRERKAKERLRHERRWINRMRDRNRRTAPTRVYAQSPCPTAYHRESHGSKTTSHGGSRRTTGSGSTSSGESGDSDPEPPASLGARRQGINPSELAGLAAPTGRGR
jgi:hypothetical protein